MITFKWNKRDFSEERKFVDSNDLKKYISAELHNWKNLDDTDIFSWKNSRSSKEEWCVIAGGQFVGISDKKF